jgi:biotin carboxylase
MTPQVLRVLVVGVVPALAETGRFGGPGRLGSAEVRTTVLCRPDGVHRLGGAGDYWFELVVMDADAGPSEWVATAQEMHEKIPFSAIVCLEDPEQPTAARIAQALNLRWHSDQSVNLVLDKTLMRSRLATAGLDATPHRAVASASEVVDFLREQEAPVVLKPRMGTGGVAVAVSTPQEAFRAWDDLAAQCPPEWGSMVAERQLIGPLLLVDTFSEDGQHTVVGIVRRYNLPGRFVGVGYACPSGFGEQIEQEISEFVLRALDALDVTTGPCHTEIILTADGPRMLETHLRPGGSVVTHLLRDVTGTDVPIYTLMQALGLRGLVINGGLPPLVRPAAKASACWYLAARCEGVVRQVHGGDTLRGMASVVDHRLAVEPGQLIRPPQSLDDRLGYVRCHGADPQEALDRCRAAAATIDVLVSAVQDPNGPTV